MVKTETAAKLTKKLCAYERQDGQRCNHITVDENDLCILHLKDLEKNKELFIDAFNSEIDRQRDDSILNIEGLVFPVPFILEDIAWDNLKAIAGNRTYFAAEVNLSDSKFEAGVSFAYAEFDGQAYFMNMDFGQCATFRGASFRNSARFDDARLENADFMNTHFHDAADFQRTVFSGKTDFSSAKFYKRTCFNDGRFSSKVYFGDARFIDDVGFRQTTFGSATFNGAEFCKKALFNNAEFKGSSTFFKTQFLGAALFSSVNFDELTIFRFTDFKKHVVFQNSTLRCLFDSCGLRVVILYGSDLTNAEFRNVWLGGCIFANANGIEDCRFSAVKWYERNGRWVLLDEQCLRWTAKAWEIFQLDETNLQYIAPPLSFVATETAYRGLRANYESHKNFPDAGHFHYGEMEMRRLASKNWFERTIGSIDSLYWLLSGYGERAWRAAIAFFVVLFMFASLYSWQENLSFDEGIFLSARVALLRSNLFSDTFSKTTSWAMLAETVAGPLTLGLFALAIRRRFRRN